jgi:hypothetical protein
VGEEIELMKIRSSAGAGFLTLTKVNERLLQVLSLHTYCIPLKQLLANLILGHPDTFLPAWHELRNLSK